MIRRLRCGVRAAASAALLTMAAASSAQTTPAPGAAPAPTTPAPQAEAPRPARQFATDQQILDEINARIALLKAELRLTDAQAAHWPAFETALRDARAARARSALAVQKKAMEERDAFRDRMRQWREERRRADQGAAGERPAPPRPAVTDIQAMRAQAEVMAARASEIRAIADAAGPLYDSLDEAQRGRLMRGIRTVGEGIRAMRGDGRGMMRGEGRGMMRGEERGWRGRRGWEE